MDNDPTDDECEALADEAERGYSLDDLQPGRFVPLKGGTFVGEVGTFDDFEHEDPDDSEAVDAYAAEVIEAVEAFDIPIPDPYGRVFPTGGQR